MPERVTSVLLQPGVGAALAAASWGGLLAGVAGLYRLWWGRVLLGLQASVVALLSLGLLPMFLTRVIVREMTLGVWLTPPSLSSDSMAGTGRIELAYAIDAMGLTVMAVVSCLVILMLSTGTPGGQSRRVAHRGMSSRGTPARIALSAEWSTDTAGFLLLLLLYEAALQFALSSQLIVQLACWQLMSVCCFLGSRRASAGRTTPAARCPDRRVDPPRIDQPVHAGCALHQFLWRLAADAMLWLALAFAAVQFPSTDVPPARISAAVAIEFIVGVFLWLGVLGRSFAWSLVRADTDDMQSHPPLLAMDRLVVAPFGFLLLLRSRPLFDVSAAAWNLLLLSGMVAAVVAAGRGVRREFGGGASKQEAGIGRAIRFLRPVFIGMMFAGVGSGHPQGTHGAILLFAATVLLLPILNAHLHGHGRSRTGSAVVTLALGAVALGLTGQAHVISSLVAQFEAHPIPRQAALPSQWVLALSGTGLIAAQGMTAFALVRRCRIPVAQPRRETEPRESPSATEEVGIETVALRQGAGRALPVVSVVFATLLVAGYLLPGGWDRQYGDFILQGREQPTLDWFIVVLTALVGAIGGTLGWMTAETEVETPPGKDRGVAQPTAPTAPRFPNRPATAVSPLESIGYVCRWLDRFVLGQLRDLCARFPRALAEAGEPLQNGTVRMLVLWLFLATAVLLGVVVGMGMWP